MQVINGLSPVRIAVNHDPISIVGNPKLHGQPLRGQHHFPQQALIILISLIQRRQSPVGHDKNVNWRNGIDVMECRHILILVDDPCRDLPAYDPAEYGVARLVWHSDSIDDRSVVSRPALTSFYWFSLGGAVTCTFLNEISVPGLSRSVRASNPISPVANVFSSRCSIN